MYFKYLLILCSLIIPSKLFAYSFDQKTSDREITKFYDFSKMPNYYLPHRYDTTKKAAQIENETLKVTVEPGMRGASSDKKCQCRERAELGFRTSINGTTYYSFKFKIDKNGFKTVDKNFDEVRTSIAQIKFYPENPQGTQPALAVHADNYGLAYCTYYKSNSDPKRYRVKLYDLHKIDLNDGEWHKIEMSYKPSKTRGYCKIVIDDQVILEKKNLNNLPIKKIKFVRSRIGINRDSLSYSQTVYYDDLTIKFTPE